MSYMLENNMETRYSKFRYYLLFLYYKLRIFVDCTTGLDRLLLAESIHIWNLLSRTYHEMPGSDKIREIDTIFGKYKLIGDNYGYSILSPAFERPDKDLLISMINDAVRQNKSVLFLDIGGFVGDYTIGVSLKVKKNSVTTVAFEPDSDYYKLFITNLRMNHITQCKVYNIGLSNKDTEIKEPRFPTLMHVLPSKILKFRLRRLDDILPESFYKKFDEIFVKIDIEGHEEATFDGAADLINSGKEIHLMIEDCVNPAVTRYLKRHKWRFITKITPYDSFWALN